MELGLYLLVRTVVSLVQRLPLRLAARLGRLGGELFYWLDPRHRRVALGNLAMCFGAEKSRQELRRLARENFRRIGENYTCAVKTAAMSFAELEPHLEVVGAEKILQSAPPGSGTSCLLAIGHFGNFELYARFARFLPGLNGATTYRALRQRSLNRLMMELRSKSGCLFFERRSEAKALRAAINRGGLILGLLADQHAGDAGLRLPFLGHECSASAAPAVLALRYHCRLFTAICFRIELARWRIEVGDEIPTHEKGKARPVEVITQDFNRAFEAAVRRDPANWFWVHKRWKPPPARRRARRHKPEETADAGAGQPLVSP